MSVVVAVTTGVATAVATSFTATSHGSTLSTQACLFRFTAVNYTCKQFVKLAGGVAFKFCKFLTQIGLSKFFFNQIC